MSHINLGQLPLYAWISAYKSFPKHALRSDSQENLCMFCFSRTTVPSKNLISMFLEALVLLLRLHRVVIKDFKVPWKLRFAQASFCSVKSQYSVFVCFCIPRED